jgi:hypothetical protein
MNTAIVSPSVRDMCRLTPGNLPASTARAVAIVMPTTADRSWLAGRKGLLPKRTGIGGPRRCVEEVPRPQHTRAGASSCSSQ